MPADFRIRFADVDDADTIEPWLRPADYDELAAASGPDVLGQLREAVRLSQGRLGRMAFVAELGGKVVSLWGFVPASMLGEVAFPWMVGTPELARIPGILKRTTTAYCSVVLGEYPLLVNYVDARNKVSIRWLKSVGFTLGPAEPFGVEQMPFHRFEMRGEPRV